MYFEVEDSEQHTRGECGSKDDKEERVAEIELRSGIP